MKLREFRKLLDLTLEEMADCLSDCGRNIGIEEYLDIECHECIPDYRMMAAFKEAFPFASIDKVFF